MPKLSTPLWEHFIKDPATKTGVCNYCKKTLSYKTTITNLKQHLKYKHRSAYDELYVSIGSIGNETETTATGTESRFKEFVRLRQSNNAIWEHFDRDRSTKTAECHYCNKNLSYRTTVTNLKQHLKLKHLSMYIESNIGSNQNPETNTIHSNQETSIIKPSKNIIWKHFKKGPCRTARCYYCKKRLCYEATTASLKRHLKKKHPNAFEELNSSTATERDCLDTESINIKTDHSDTDSETEQSDDDDAEELLKLTDVWSYFEQESGRRARCVVCRTTLDNGYEELKAHLKESHPKLLLQIMQEKDLTSDATFNEDDQENTYTEIVYLEQESSQEDTPKPKEKPVVPKITPRTTRKRERLNSSADDFIFKRKKDNDDNENDELGTFIKYITCLLKKLPQDMFSKVQAEIISIIMTANSNAKAVESSPRVVFENPQSTVANLVTVSEMTPNSSVLGTHNYTITVGPKDNEAVDADVE